jgi:hypothetical protein
MLKNLKNRLRKNSRNNSELKGTLGENVRDSIIKAGIKTAEDSGYAAGNTTEKMVEIASSIGNGVDLGTQLGLGSESASSIGRIAFKATKDIARGDSVCIGLCLLSGACETIALGCSTCKFIPYRGRIYVCAKIVSKGCMTYRNNCAGEGC